MNWDELLCEERFAPVEEEPKQFSKYPISEFEKDYKTIISSAAFRRLQDKTQVFPLDKSDFVRTRLTHSLEVSTIAKQLGGMIINNFIIKNKSAATEKRGEDMVSHMRQILDVLMCAGLLHDLGNPPFGHFGEVIIQDWFKNHFNDDSFTYRGEKIVDLLPESTRKDMENFEGNAQALRILAKCRGNPEGGGINLTYGVINTLIKYPGFSADVNKNSANIKEHKFGVFISESEAFNEVTSKTGTGTNRHPLTYILEAADDIAYATADLEDAFKKGLFSLDAFISYYCGVIEDLEKKIKTKYDKSDNLIKGLQERLSNAARNQENDARHFHDWVSWARNWLMYAAAYKFTKEYEKIMNGEWERDLFDYTVHHLSIQALKKSMQKFVYHSPAILKLELSAHSIITSLLDKFVAAALYFESEDLNYPQINSCAKLMDLVSENLKNDYASSQKDNEEYNLYLRFLLVTDFISGMTDSFAKELYQELNGY
ncbi:MAG: deoxyguanosinetriphosphate triphosphohydrolase [Oscillospiraceae bacterium]|jgi:dGTPase|nr:deoxyguanosinetriphosphate triphosphohydrolase [Oscillospiraceae bacterium]